MQSLPPGAAPEYTKDVVPVGPAPKRPIRVAGMTDEIVAMCFAEADVNRDGKIDGKEYCHLRVSFFIF